MKKVFNLMSNIGKAKYVVNFHDGVQKHKDGSAFFAISIFKSKKKRDLFVESLINKGFELQRI